MTTSDWSSFLVSQTWHLPALVVATTGIILAVTRWQRHPNVSLLTLVAFSLLLANRLIWAGGIPLWRDVAASSSVSVHHGGYSRTNCESVSLHCGTVLTDGRHLRLAIVSAYT